MAGTHEFIEDERNQDVLIYVNGEFFPRHEAKVSVFDSAFLVGDGIWESFRLHNGKLAFVKQHLARLKANAKALDYDWEDLRKLSLMKFIRPSAQTT